MGTNLTEVVAVLIKVNGQWRCYKHPHYGAHRAPTSKCKACELLWLEETTE